MGMGSVGTFGNDKEDARANGDREGDGDGGYALERGRAYGEGGNGFCSRVSRDVDVVEIDSTESGEPKVSKSALPSPARSSRLPLPLSCLVKTSFLH